MATRARAAAFDPAAFSTFRFVSYALSDTGELRLRYALDDAVFFEEVLQFPLPPGATPARSEALERAVWLLHLVAGISYFKTAVPAQIGVETATPGPAVAAFLTDLYLHGLGEFAYRNRLDLRDRVTFPSAGRDDSPAPAVRGAGSTLVPVGGGKDSVVTIEMLRRSPRVLTLFSVNDPPAIAATVATAGLPRLLTTRAIDPILTSLNAAGALNGHIPVTAVVSLAAVVAALLNDIEAIAMSNERSASEGNLHWLGQEVNHQYSKGIAFEGGLRTVLQHTGVPVDYFSALRPASELAIARAFARVDRYAPAITSCNAAFRLDPGRRQIGWCGDCPKCRFVFLILAPFIDPAALVAMIGRDMLGDATQYNGFRALMGIDADKPFECVGERAESVAAFRLLADDPHWQRAPVVRRVAAEVLAQLPDALGRPADVLALSDEHFLPDDLGDAVDATLGH
jgi:UDP-N-acetyl-alpha-D-muramoyl-L-alanyl-L-glutamate epimerase